MNKIKLNFGKIILPFMLICASHTFAANEAAKSAVEAFSPYSFPAKLFDQSFLNDPQYANTLKSEGFLIEATGTGEIDSDALNKICSDAFESKRNKIARDEMIYKALLPILVPPFALGSLAAGGYFARSLKTSGLKLISACGTINQYGDFEPTSLGIGLATAAYFGGLGALIAYFAMMPHAWGKGAQAFKFVTANNDPMIVYCREYAAKKRFLNFLDMETDKNDFKEYGKVPYVEEELCKGNTSLMKTFLSIPIKSIQPLYTPESAQDCFALYSQETQTLLMRTCNSHMRAYQAHIGVNKKSREFLTLLSAPGTGKSRLVQEIGAFMGIPVTTICLADTTVDKLFGTESHPGLILEKLGQLGSRNGILFFDELDRVTDDKKLLSILLPFLEPSAKTFYSPYLKRNIDVSHLFVVVAGNLSFQDAALKSRFNALKTASLEIHDAKKLVSIVMNEYLRTKLEPCERTLITADLKRCWAEQIHSYVKEQPFLSFRDAQAKLDLLVSEWQMNGYPVNG